MDDRYIINKCNIILNSQSFCISDIYNIYSHMTSMSQIIIFNT